MTALDLDPLFRPASIAVVGASDDPNRIGGRPVRYLKEAGYAGEIYGVNPKYETVQGAPCVAEVEQLPAGIDLYVIATPAPVVPVTLESAAENGARAAIVFAGGFAETGDEGRERQRRVAEIAQRHRLPVVGPNCLGIASYTHRNFTTLSTSITDLVGLPAGRIALVSQSGGFAANVASEAARHGARFSHLVTTGNEAVVQFGDYLGYLAEDEHTDAVIGYIEGIRDGDRFTAGLAAMRAVGKPVSLLQVGRSPQGAAAVGAHTALMSDSTAAVDAALRRYGVHRLDDFTDLTDAVIGAGSNVTSGGLVVATISGGTAVYIVDACQRLGVPLAELSESTVERLADIVPSYGSLRNPVDLTAQVVNDMDSLDASMRVLADEPGAANVLMFIGGSEAAADRIIAALSSIPAAAEGRIWLSWLGVSEQARTAAREAGIRTFADPVECLRILAHATRVPTKPAASRTTWSEGVVDLPDVEYVRLGDGRIAIDEWQGMRLLDAAGVSTPRRWLVESGDGLDAVATQVAYPCVVKLMRPYLEHRSVQGAVRTDVSDAADLAKSWHSFIDMHAATSALVAEQETGHAELIVGALRDVAFGVRVVVGSGGVRANDLADYITLIPPFHDDYIAAELERLEVRHRLGHLPGVSVEIGRLVRACVAILRSRPELNEFEVNPALVTDRGLVAVDALGTGRGASCVDS